MEESEPVGVVVTEEMSFLQRLLDANLALAMVVLPDAVLDPGDLYGCV